MAKSTKSIDTSNFSIYNTVTKIPIKKPIILPIEEIFPEYSLFASGINSLETT